MILIFCAFLAIAAFLISFKVLKILPAAQLALARTGKASRTMRDQDLSDSQKEKAIQRLALELLGSVASIGLRFAGCLLTTLAPIYAFSAMGWLPAKDTFAFLSRWDVIVLSSLALIAGFALYRKFAKAQTDGDYSTLDHALHRLAFAAPFVQLTAADIEDSIYSKDIANVPDRPPIFIAALPRAGTTVMLNALHDLPGLATHLYRDMPFVMAPLLWSRLSERFSKANAPKERAHGDGIWVGYDSPEAFEEIIWKAFWPEKYHHDKIDLWGVSDQKPDATRFLKQHFRKIVAVRRAQDGRYLSKNNGNIARLGLLTKMFPDASVIVPLRQPLEHANSLLRQHINFSNKHQQDPFSKRYMKDIGHFEFGALHRPIAFPDFEILRGESLPSSCDYWLTYWIAAHRHIAANRETLRIVPQDALQNDADRIMAKLCHDMNIGSQGADFSKHFRQVAKSADSNQFDPTLRDEASALYQDLAENSEYR